MFYLFRNTRFARVRSWMPLFKSRFIDDQGATSAIGSEVGSRCSFVALLAVILIRGTETNAAEASAVMEWLGFRVSLLSIAARSNRPV